MLKKPETKFQKWFYEQLYKNYMNNSQVAEKLHVTRQVISVQYLRGTRPSYLWILGYCKVFNIDNPDKVYEELEDES